MKTPVIYVDIDGTIANPEHRLHWIQSSPKNWNAFFKGVLDDRPIESVIHTIRCLREIGNLVVIVTGRSDICREDTEEWLRRNGIDYHDMYMRTTGDHRADDIVKSEMIDEIEKKYTIRYAFDDRTNVVNMLRNRGIFVFDCNQTGKEY